MASLRPPVVDDDDEDDDDDDEDDDAAADGPARFFDKLVKFYFVFFFCLINRI